MTDDLRLEYRVNGRKYSLTSDLHTHTTFSHGSGSIDDNVISARAKGIYTIGICDHGPGHALYGIKRSDVPVMRAEIERLSHEYPDMNILLGVEANIIGGSGKLDVKESEFRFYDFIAAGYHYAAWGSNPVYGVYRMVRNYTTSKTEIVTKSAIRANTRNVVRAIENYNIKILTHPGDKAPVDLLEVAVACAKNNTLVELNTHHRSLTAEDIKTMMLADIYFIISSDAHSPDYVGNFISAVNLAIDAGIDMARIINLKVE
jgi:putative hydrolase